MSNGTLLVATAGQAGADVGLCVSRDTGDTWERVDSRLLHDFHTDIHSIHVLPKHGEKTVVVLPTCAGMAWN